jgi:hypothetical protein
MYCSEEKPKKHEKTSKGYNQQIERIKKNIILMKEWFRRRGRELLLCS